MRGMNEALPISAHRWKRDALDWYVEPDWCDEALFQQVTFTAPIYDPACGLGRIVHAAHAAGYGAFGTDIVSRSSYCVEERDFLDPLHTVCEVECIVTNPPFKHAVAFAEKALRVAKNEVAFLLPARFIWGATRSRWLAQTPLRRVLAIAPRPSMPSGGFILAGGKAGGGKEDFVWLIFERGYRGKPEFGWLRKP